MELAAMKKLLILLFLLIGANVYAQSQKKDKVITSDLPSLFSRHSEKRLDAWEDRRGEIMKLLQEHEYGKIPSSSEISVEYRLKSVDKKALNGLAERKEVDIVFHKENKECILHLLMYLPKGTIRPAAFLGVNAMGNHTVCGQDSLSWNVVETLQRRYAFVTFCCKDICDDNITGPEHKLGEMLYGTQRDSTSCGFIGMIAWGMSRVLDYLETDSAVDARKVIAVGHSRYGKIALWAAAQDERFAASVANSSGSGGVSLYRGNRVETPYDICKRFPHWMCGKFHKYADVKNDFPIDQHMVLSLIAPRPLYIANSDKDLYVSPELEYASLLEVVPVYELYGYPLNYPEILPEVGSVIFQRVGYHLKPGPHSITPFDWKRFYEFADRYVVQNSDPTPAVCQADKK